MSARISGTSQDLEYCALLSFKCVFFLLRIICGKEFAEKVCTGNNIGIGIWLSTRLTLVLYMPMLQHQYHLYMYVCICHFF